MVATEDIKKNRVVELNMNKYYALNGELSCVDDTYAIKTLLKKIKVDIEFLSQLDTFLAKLENRSITDEKFWIKKTQQTLLASKRCYYNIQQLMEAYKDFDTHSHICNHFSQLKKNITTEIITAGFSDAGLDSRLVEARDSIEAFLESNGAKKSNLILSEYKRLDLIINNELLKKIKSSEILLSKLTDLHFYIMNITISKSQ